MTAIHNAYSLPILSKILPTDIFYDDFSSSRHQTNKCRSGSSLGTSSGHNRDEQKAVKAERCLAVDPRNKWRKCHFYLQLFFKANKHMVWLESAGWFSACDI